MTAFGKISLCKYYFCSYCQKQPFCVCSVCFCSFVYSCSSLAILVIVFFWKLSKKNLNNSMMIKNIFMCVCCGEELQQLKLNQTKTQGPAALLTLKRILILFICFTWSLLSFSPLLKVSCCKFSSFFVHIFCKWSNLKSWSLLALMSCSESLISWQALQISLLVRKQLNCTRP